MLADATSMVASTGQRALVTVAQRDRHHHVFESASTPGTLARVQRGAPWLMLGGVLASCEARPVTQLLVVVESDLAPGSELSLVEIHVNDDEPRRLEVVTGTPAEGRVGMPFSFGVV